MGHHVSVFPFSISRRFDLAFVCPLFADKTRTVFVLSGNYNRKMVCSGSALGP